MEPLPRRHAVATILPPVLAVVGGTDDGSAPRHRQQPERGVEFDVLCPGRIVVAQYTAAAAAAIPRAPGELRIGDHEGVWIIRPIRDRA